MTLLALRPKVVSASMFMSLADSAREKLQVQEASAFANVEQQRIEMRQSQWNLFTSGLSRDQALAAQLKELPLAFSRFLHLKQVRARNEQAEAGEKAVSAYQEKFLYVSHFTKIELFLAKVIQVKARIASWIKFSRASEGLLAPGRL